MEVMTFFLEFRLADQRDRRSGQLRLRRVDLWKSALLGRLMRGEEIRRRPCPTHKGVMWCSWGFDALSCACQGTGWLANEPERPETST